MNSILIYARNRQSFAGLFEVMKQLENFGQIRIVLTTSDPAMQALSKTFRDDLPTRFIRFDESFKYRWDAVISAHLPPGNTLWNGPLMIIPHGTGFGVTGSYAEVLASNCAIYFGHHPAEYHYLKTRLGQTFKKEKFVPTGSPHTDELARYIDQKPEERMALKQELGFEPDLPVILISSHWTPDSILRTWGVNALTELQPFAEQYNIVQIGHQLLWDFPTYDTHNPGKKLAGKTLKFDSGKLFHDLNEYCKDRSRVHFLPGANTWKALATADLMIGDYSSIIIEYSALDRPIVFTNRKNRFNSKTSYQRYAAACGAANSLSQLAEAVTKEWKDPQNRSAARQELAMTFVWNLGNAAQTVAQEILKRI